jgi:hypothetical protein
VVEVKKKVRAVPTASGAQQRNPMLRKPPSSLGPYALRRRARCLRPPRPPLPPRHARLPAGPGL